MSAPTLTHDERGRVVLTAEQALQVARWWRGSAHADHAEIERLFHGHQDQAGLALAAWVERWAPVVEAADRWLAARNAGLRFPPSRPAGQDYDRACTVLAAHVAVARESGAS